ncbi:ABC-2 family transporter protein [Sinomicrobium oceani]|uniref:ABC-2 family transporter protein n=1 Tax=Sinomicrobium oceani TaxID=1150368 RepID=A0A1K1M8I2_9FLAO|nr:DUF3526 domain-containing protein [Sinomicrobium oceani]SFW18278.1 ABC-2 family transporter protein [Sinomicrobium oceani]
MRRLSLIIFRFEWQQLTRRLVPVIAMVCFVLMGSYSLYNGSAFTKRQLQGIDSIEQHFLEHRSALLNRFQADTTTKEGKLMAVQAGIPQVVEYRNPPYTVFPPSRLSALAIGQRDLLPYFDIITSKRNDLTSSRTEIINPEQLAAGNLDFSFVFIYLFPLLLVVWGYDVYSGEAEQQTEKLLAVQGAALKPVLAFKLLFRVGCVCIIAWALSIAGFGIHRIAGMSFADGLYWLGGITLYLVFWGMLVWLVILGGKSSHVTLIRLVGIWFSLTFLFPAIAYETVEVIYPVPSHTALISDQREEVEQTWEIPVGELLDIYYENNPQYVSLRSPSDTAQYGNRRFVAYYDLLDRRIRKHAEDYNHRADRHYDMLDRLGWVSPVLQMQTSLNTVARTGPDDFAAYREQVSDYRDEWVSHMNRFMLHNRKLKPADIAELPLFTFHEIPGRANRVFRSVWPVFLWTLILFFLSKRKTL